MGLLAFFGKRTINQIEEKSKKQEDKHMQQDERLRLIEKNYIGREELTGAVNRVYDSIESHNEKMETHIQRIETEVRGDLKDMSKTISGLTAAIIKKGNRSGSITDD